MSAILLPERQVEHSRKRRWCHWCGQWIEIGDTYWKWFDAGDFHGEVRMHPECRDAFHAYDWDSDDTWGTGENNRGCSCFNDDQCKKCYPSKTRHE